MSLTRNTLYNIGGASASIIVALVTVPLYLHQVGEARYGVLALVWLLLGYFGLFDLGLSRATANYIARMRGRGQSDQDDVFWTAMVLNSVLGVVGGAVLWFAGGPLFGRWFAMSPALHHEAMAALPWIAAAVPVATSTAVMTGALTGQERFGVVNLVQMTGMLLFQVLPLVAAFVVGRELYIVIPAAVIARCAVVIPLFLVVKRLLPLTGRPRIDRQCARELLGYGVWVTVTNLISPILDTFDRFFIGVVMSTTAVAFYDVPFRLVAKAKIVPDGLSQALFPRLSAQTQAVALRTARDSVAAINGFMTPLVVVGLLLISPFLKLWVGSAFAQNAAPVGIVLLLGIWINSLADVPYAKLQAQGRPDWVAKAHAMEVIPYLVGLWWALHHFALVGAAAVWSIRAAVDAALLFWLSHLGFKVLVPLVPSAALICAAWLLVSFPVPLVVLNVAGVAAALLSLAWGLMCSSVLRATLLAAYGQVRGSVRRLLAAGPQS